MKKVHITEAFTGYPNGKDERRFAKGEEPELSDTFADLIVNKGHARLVDAKAAPQKETEK